MFDQLSDKFTDAFRHLRGKGTISESNIDETLGEVRKALLEADVNFKVVKSFVANVKEKAIGEKVVQGVEPGEQFVKIMHDELAAIMGEENEQINLERKPVIPIIIVGLNGAGKTTLSGKLSLWLRNKAKKEALLVPADNFRPAAKEQLQTLAKQMTIDCFDSDLSLSPKEIALAGMKAAAEQGKDIAIIDTAGRLQVDDELMGQLEDVKKSLASMNPEVLFVADAMTGQEAVNVAKTFHDRIGLTGIVLSKMDSDARGGAALSIRHVTGVPIRYISVGEKMKELELFHPDRMAKRILDMGDVLTLVERAQEVVDEKEAEKMMKRLEKNKFTVNDFMKQMDQMSKLGSMESLLKMIPGMGGMVKQMGDLSPAEDEMKKMKVIISSMTEKERDDHTILNGSRRKRIASGSGRTMQDVNQFIEKFEMMKKMMGGMMGMMKSGAGMPGLGDLGGLLGGGDGVQKGFRQQPGGKQKKKKKGKRKGPWGGGFFVFFLLSFISVHAADLEPCGEHPQEKALSDKTWVKLIDLTIKSVVMDVESVLCVGFTNKNEKMFEHLTFRADTGIFKSYSFSELQKDVVIATNEVGRSDFPRVAASFLKRRKLISLQVSKITNGESHSTIDVNLHFQRNMGKFSGKRDIRLLKMSARREWGAEVVQLKGSVDAPTFATSVEIDNSTWGTVQGFNFTQKNGRKLVIDPTKLTKVNKHKHL